MVRRARRWQIGTKQVDLPLIPLPNGLQARALPFVNHITFSDVIVKFVWNTSVAFGVVTW